MRLVQSFSLPIQNTVCNQLHITPCECRRSCVCCCDECVFSHSDVLGTDCVAVAGARALKTIFPQLSTILHMGVFRSWMQGSCILTQKLWYPCQHALREEWKARQYRGRIREMVLVPRKEELGMCMPQDLNAAVILAQAIVRIMEHRPNDCYDFFYFESLSVVNSVSSFIRSQFRNDYYYCKSLNATSAYKQ